MTLDRLSRERHAAGGPRSMVAAFSVSAVCYSSRCAAASRCRVPPRFSSPSTRAPFLPAARIADEFGFEDDARYRPYRPVPRGR
jgi:4-hydroxybenzoate polyprenyltransferase